MLADQWPTDVRYDTTYWVFLVMATGWAKVRVCQPVVDSLLKVPSASRVPVEVHSDPVCDPVLPGAL